uniref:Uncharacterized protein n=1 Tax=Tanacetum cinerariifolium TaxID=118510 RepID=A0A699GZV0_TANCI|nr:hypothetical protein [Tanacetum cinerariifolium]
MIYDLDKTPDLSQRSPQNCPKCGHPVSGHYCQGCALVRKKFKEDLFTSCIENGILQDSFKPSNDNTNVVNALREPFVLNQDPGIFCHKCTCELCGNGAHYGYNCPPKVPIIPNPEPFNNQTISPHQLYKVLIPNLILFMILLTFLTHLHNFLFILVNSAGTMLQYTVNHPVFNVQNDLFDSQNKLMEQLTSMCDMVGQFIQKKEEEKQIEEDQTANSRYWKIPACYDDDDDDYTFAITPNESNNSLSMGDEHLDTVSAMESDEFIKSSVENLVPNPSESVDDQSFSNEDFSKEIYSSPLFDEEIISKKIEPRHYNVESDLIESLLDHDSLIISSSFKMDFLFDEFAEFVFENSDADIESFSPSPIPVEDSDSLMEEIDLSFTPDYPMSPDIEEDDYDSKRDILILEAMIPFHFLKMRHFILIFLHPFVLLQNHQMEKSPDLLSHQGLEAIQPSAECPMMIHENNTPILDVPLFHFCPP